MRQHLFSTNNLGGPSENLTDIRISNILSVDSNSIFMLFILLFQLASIEN